MASMATARSGTHRVSVLPGVDQAIEVRERPMPDLPPDGVLIRVELAGVCATDLHIVRGHIPDFGYPVTLGHELCGIVEEVAEGFGTDVRGRTVRRGDRVAVMPATPCGRCGPCRRADPVPACENFDVHGFSDPDARPGAGGWAQYVTGGPRTRLFVTDAPAHCAVLAEPASTPVEGLARAGFRLGDSVLVQGTGTVGLLAVAAAVTGGASRVVAIGGPARRLDLARTLGTDATVDIAELPRPSTRRDAVLNLSPNGRGYDLVVECAGVPSTVPEGLGYLRDGGTFVELGHFSDVGDVAINPYRHLLARDARVVASSGYSPDSFGRALGVCERLGDLAATLITHRLPLDRAGDAVGALSPEQGWTLDGDQVGKLVIDPWAG